MRLLPVCEVLCGQILHRSPMPTLDEALAELLTEETRLRVLPTYLSPTPTALVVGTQMVPAPTSTTPAIGTQISSFPPLTYTSSQKYNKKV